VTRIINPPGEERRSSVPSGRPNTPYERRPVAATYQPRGGEFVFSTIGLREGKKKA